MTRRDFGIQKNISLHLDKSKYNSYLYFTQIIDVSSFFHDRIRAVHCHISRLTSIIMPLATNSKAL
ncbi:hypothetical protein DENSPDRAFT_836529 [Dentipellis sp. KUC8613]|nr:hypothetical protein DENSPDRAFT_836529 [Dentipellis sp. KUC8613]